MGLVSDERELKPDVVNDGASVMIILWLKWNRMVKYNDDSFSQLKRYTAWYPDLKSKIFLTSYDEPQVEDSSQKYKGVNYFQLPPHHIQRTPSL